ncbi:defensin-like protein 37 [Vicia villosa]|uniref:defensin-like protein 37 n=1 Tax=Vicia villosa TaxID=3911 RepID=UPI00273BD020|nr:defensin-like protein 37 [Vicia villosa]
MASYVNQTSFFWILCFALVLLSGFATCLGPVGPPGLTCSGKCTNPAACNKSCIDKGFKNGGTCEGFSPQDLSCCCKH